MGKPTSETRFRLSDRHSPAFGNGFRYEVSDPEYIGVKKRTRGTETSKYPEERTSIETPSVVASERGSGQWQLQDKPNRLESRAIVGDSPVRVMRAIVLE